MTDLLPTWSELEAIAARFGSDFYIADTAHFESNCAAFETAFRTFVPNTRPAYSVKTNYVPEFFKRATARGWYVEVVSGFEYDLVRRHGVPGRDIIFNGPVKFQHELERALADGALVNVDSFQELATLSNITTRRRDLPCRIALRCNLGPAHTAESRFGLPVDSPEFGAVLENIKRGSLGNISLEGLHVHYCYAGKRPHDYSVASERLATLLRHHDLGSALSSLNLGGGFFSSMPDEMARQFGGNIPTARDYAEHICDPLLSVFKSAPRLQLILEPGLIIVADAMRFFCKVHAIKSFGTRDEIIITGSVYNVKPSKSRIDMPLSVIKPVRPTNLVAGRVSGFTCMEDDILHSQFSGDVAEGDYLAFYNVGAYTNVLKPPFIRLAPPILAARRDTGELTMDVLCEAEDFEAINSRFPCGR